VAARRDVREIVHSQLQALNVFLASPGDLVEERKIARLVVEELNNSIGRPLGWRIELYGWEDTPIGIVRPQSQINEEVNQCDLFVGLLWERWGRPPGDSEYKSGFEEELELAKARWTRDGRPQIWLFLKDIDPKLLKYPGDQTKLVLAFRQKTMAEQKLFYKEFSDIDEWTSEFRKRLSYYLVNLAATRTQPSTPSVSPERHFDRTQDVKSPASGKSQAVDPSAQEAIDSVTAISQAITTGALNGFEAKSSNETTVARLILLTAAFQASQIRGELLGTHQSNIIYRLRSQISPTKSEWLLLLRTMLANNTQSIPGWAWAKPSTGFGRILLHIARTDESEEVVVGTLRILRELSIVPKDRDRRQLFTTLLDSKHEASLIEALRWLETYGKRSDQWFAAKAKKIASNEVRSAADDALLAILARTDAAEAYTLLSATDQKPSESIVADLLQRVDLDALQLGISHQLSIVRKLSAIELRRRNAATKQVAATLIEDPDTDVQRVGIEIAIALGERPSFEKIRSIVKPTGLLAALGSTASREADELILESLKDLPEIVLLKGNDWYSINGPLIYSALGQKYFPTFGTQLRADLADNFATLYRTSSERTNEQFGAAGQNQVESYKRENLNDFIRKQYVKAAIGALARHGSADDRPLMDPFIESADSDLAPFLGEFLGKHGQSSDARTLLGLYEKSWINRDQLLPLAVKLSETPSLFLFDLSLNETTRAKIVPLLSESQVQAVRNDWLSLLSDDNADIRKGWVLRIFTLTNATQRKKLIDALQAKPTYYYDVIHWLDRLSYPTKTWQALFAESLSKHLNRPYRKDWLRE
jgi:hypothetical protein